MVDHSIIRPYSATVARDKASGHGSNESYGCATNRAFTTHDKDSPRNKYPPTVFCTGYNQQAITLFGFYNFMKFAAESGRFTTVRQMF